MPGIFFLLAYFFICVAGSAQQYPFVHYTPKDGLVNSRVRKAYQDSRGRMYFMTFGGLSVYDGARFKNYTTQNGLIADLVNDVLELGDDSLLVAINSCGLNILVHGEMKMANIRQNSCPIVNQFLKSNDGDIYATTDDGLYRLRHDSLQKLPAFYPDPLHPANYLGDITAYKDYIIFTTNDVRHNRGVFLYSKKKNAITDAVPQVLVQGLESDRNGIAWISTPGVMYNFDTTALMNGRIEFRAPYASFVDSQTLVSGNLVFNHRNEPFIASTNRGITRYSRDGTQLMIASSELSDISVQNFFIDREDILWICHDGNGVYKLSNTKLQSTDTFSRETRSEIRAVKYFKPSSAWIVMTNGQWILHDPSGTRQFSISPAMDASPLEYTKTHLYAIRLNQLYMAPLPKNRETTIRFKKIITLPDTASFGSESAIDPYGNIISFESRNIFVLHHEKQLFNYPFSSYDLIEGMHIDKNNLLWVIARASRMMVFSLHPDDPSHYLQKEFQFINDFGAASPRCIVVDKNEILWVGTRDDGLMGFEYKNNRLQKRYQFQTQNGLTDNFVTALTCDNNNNIIVGTQTGIDRLVKTDIGYRVENITKSNNIFAYIKFAWTEANNTVFAVTNAGTVFQVEPELFSRPVAEPKLIIEGIRVNGTIVSPTSSPLRLSYYQRNISFSVAAPTFVDERQVQYSYLLAGSGNKQWSDTSSVADINLLNLAPGHYTLHVEAFFRSTSYPSKEMTFSFQILPPWWQTWWFRAPAIIAIIGLLFLAARFYYRRKLEQQKSLLEKQQAVEKERTRIATDMHDDLGAGLSRIKFLSETIGIKKQQQLPIEEDISKIREYSHEMIDKMGEIVWALNEKNDSLSDLLSYTRAYAVEYLSQNGIGCTVKAPEIFSTDFVAGEFRRNVFLTVKEALHNIVKHAQASYVLFEISTGNELTIEITDNGLGFDHRNVRPFSNGITNMDKRIREIGGRFEIGMDKGTIIKISVPLHA